MHRQNALIEASSRKQPLSDGERWWSLSLPFCVFNNALLIAPAKRVCQLLFVLICIGRRASHFIFTVMLPCQSSLFISVCFISCLSLVSWSSSSTQSFQLACAEGLFLCSWGPRGPAPSQLTLAWGLGRPRVHRRSGWGAFFGCHIAIPLCSVAFGILSLITLDY